MRFDSAENRLGLEDLLLIHLYRLQTNRDQVGLRRVEDIVLKRKNPAIIKKKSTQIYQCSNPWI